jgi:hypothetical protein
MDASKITELLQKRENRYINRAQQSQDASLITWNKFIQSSTVLPQVATATRPELPANVPGCETCSGMSRVNITQNSTVRKPNPMFSSKGSGSRDYTSQSITYKRAGDAYCCAETINDISTPSEAFIDLPRCFCNSVDRFEQSGEPNVWSAPPPTDSAKAWLNPYLPNPQPYIANTEPAPCISCNHYKILDDNGEEVVSTRLVPTCRSCNPRPIDPNSLP